VKDEAMPKKYVLKTESGGLYEVFDESHLFGDDHWVLIKDNKKSAILCFGELREMLAEPALLGVGATRTGKAFLRTLKGRVGDSLQNKSCRGHRVIYVSESELSSALLLLTELQNYVMTNDRPKMAKVWGQLERIVGYSSKIIDVFEG
jgi:hypothetical protein